MINEPIVQSALSLAAYMLPYVTLHGRNIDGTHICGTNPKLFKDGKTIGIICYGTEIPGKTALIAKLAMEHNAKIIIIDPKTLNKEFNDNYTIGADPFPKSQPIIIEKLPELQDHSIFEESKEQHRFIQKDSGGNIVKPRSKEDRKQMNNFSKNSYRKKRGK